MTARFSFSYAIVSSGVLLFPSGIAPAPRNRVTTVASGAGTKAFRPFVAPVLIFAGGIKIILDRDWHAVQGPLSSLRPSAGSAAHATAIRTIGAKLNHSIQLRIYLLDPCDTRTDHLLA